MTTLISPDNHFALFAIVLLAAALGLVGDRRGWFGKVSGIIVTILSTAVLATANIIPSGADPDISVPLYNMTFSYIVPMAIPLLLFNVNIRKIARESGRLLEAFLTGTVGIVIGVIIAAWLVPMGEETYKLAGVFSATYIGGSVNFFAVADVLDFMDSPLFPGAIAVDNVFTNFYFLLLFFLPSWARLRRFFPAAVKDAGPEPVAEPAGPVAKAESAPAFDTRLMESLTLALAVAAVICAVSFWLAPPLGRLIGLDIKLDLLLITVFITAISNLFPRLLAPLEPVAFQLGFFLLFVFLAVVGASSDIKEIIATTPAILLFVVITLMIHLAFMLIVCRLLRISLEELAIGSSANVGGSTTAAPMAVTFGMKQAITPAILIGILGNVIGTFIGVGIGLLLR